MPAPYLLLRRATRPDRGTVTAETALALPAVVLVLAVVTGAGQVVVAQVRCQDAARAAARLAARGETSARVAAAARDAAPEGAGVAVRSGAGSVEVDVRARVRAPVPGGPSVEVGGRAVASVEQEFP